tara:strand:+ start:829 stop:948 length:120 start_codon:yes stop_codon:yes gene_type:complete
MEWLKKYLALSLLSISIMLLNSCGTVAAKNAKIVRANKC